LDEGEGLEEDAGYLPPRQGSIKVPSPTRSLAGCVLPTNIPTSARSGGQIYSLSPLSFGGRFSSFASLTTVEGTFVPYDTMRVGSSLHKVSRMRSHDRVCRSTP